MEATPVARMAFLSFSEDASTFLSTDPKHQPSPMTPIHGIIGYSPT